MADINVEGDLTSINGQIVQLIDELNKVNAARENLMQQVQKLNGIAMYLRGKDEVANGTNIAEDLERSEGYPDIMTKET